MDRPAGSTTRMVAGKPIVFGTRGWREGFGEDEVSM